MSNYEITPGPRVYVVGKQDANESEIYRFLDDEDVAKWGTDTEIGGEILSEVAGRLCYMSFAKPRPGGNEAYIDHIVEVGHGSVLEHAVFNLIITGVSRSFTHELVRHRAGTSYSQLSQRYVDEGGSDDKPLGVVEPPLIAEARAYFNARCGNKYLPPEDAVAYWASHEIIRQWDIAVSKTSRAYRSIDAETSIFLSRVRPNLPKTDARKQAREAARSVLPNATETKIFVTINGRAARHFVEIRGAAGADAEMRGVAVAVFKALKPVCPNLWSGVAIAVDEYGVEFITSSHPKV